MSEADVLKQCLDYLKIKGIYAWRNNTGAYKKGGFYIRYGKVGSSDILGIMNDGRFLAVECKREKGGKLSEEQIDFLNAIKSRGGVAVCVRSVEELKEALES